MTTTLELNEGGAQSRPFHARLAALGFGLIALSGLLGTVVGLAGGSGGNAVFGLIVALIGLAVAGATWRFGRWALVVAAVLSVLLLALVVPFSLFSLAHPESAQDFVPIVLMIAGAVFGLIGPAAVLVQGRRGVLRSSATSGEARVLRGALVLLALAAAVSLLLTAAARLAPPEGSAGAISVAVKDMRFTPNRLQAAAGATVRLVVTNGDATLHTFTLDAAGVNVSIPPGTARVVEFKAPASGTFTWYCIPHSSADSGTRSGMVGTLVVQ